MEKVFRMGRAAFNAKASRENANNVIAVTAGVAVFFYIF